VAGEDVREAVPKCEAALHHLTRRGTSACNSHDEYGERPSGSGVAILASQSFESDSVIGEKIGFEPKEHHYGMS